MLERIISKRTVHMLLLAAALVVCLGPAHAQSTSKATAIQLVGSVSIIKDASQYRTALFNGNQVSAGQMIVTGPDGYAKFQVADGSTFEVFPDSQVTFKSTMGWGDLVNVMIGKIKVWIQHAPGIPNPNNVTTPSALISVRGTIFIVDVRDADGTTDVAVDEGIVDVRHLLRGGPKVTLIQGQATTVDPRTPLVGLGGNRGAILQRGLRAATDLVRDVMLQRNGGGGGTPGGVKPGGPQGDQGKPGDDKGGNTGTGSPTGGSGGTPPPPPPGGGGGE
jgi:hypothetical protein